MAGSSPVSAYLMTSQKTPLSGARLEEQRRRLASSARASCPPGRRPPGAADQGTKQEQIFSRRVRRLDRLLFVAAREARATEDLIVQERRQRDVSSGESVRGSSTSSAWRGLNANGARQFGEVTNLAGR